MPALISLIGLILCALASPARAEDTRSDSGIIVHIRAVRALEKVEGEPAARAGAETQDAASPETLRIDARIRDIAPKLEKFHFRTFQLISSQDEIVPLGKRQTILLTDGNQLTVRPLTIEKKRVGMWIRWQDRSGMQVLDTRMHFDCGEIMLTGVEQAANTGLILAIAVSPQARERGVPVVQPVDGPGHSGAHP